MQPRPTCAPRLLGGLQAALTRAAHSRPARLVRAAAPFVILAYLHAHMAYLLFFPR